MMLVPLTECGLRLGVDPKTLRRWLKTAQIAACPHAADARVKCLTQEQLQQVAALYDRHLPTLADPSTVLPTTSPPILADPSPALAATQEADLRHQLTLLQAQVATLQTQMTELALALLRSSPSPLLLPSLPTTHSIPAPRAAPVASRSRTPVPHASAPNPEQPRARSRAQPLIEVRADGTYVAISPTEGVLPLVPDSPEWFAWLTSLTAFSFQGKLGCYSASRKFHQGQRIQSWMLHRSLHGRSCGLYLGQTRTLTLARLEEMAATVQARLTAL